MLHHRKAANRRSEATEASYSIAASEILIHPPSHPAWSADKCALVAQIWWLEPFTAAKKHTSVQLRSSRRHRKHPWQRTGEGRDLQTCYSFITKTIPNHMTGPSIPDNGHSMGQNSNEGYWLCSSWEQSGQQCTF